MANTIFAFEGMYGTSADATPVAATWQLVELDI